jgi:non-homologous end joining protein Ku
MLKDMLDLASHIVKTKAGQFDTDKFEDQYEDALKELLKNPALNRGAKTLSFMTLSLSQTSPYLGSKKHPTLVEITKR